MSADRTTKYKASVVVQCVARITVAPKGPPPRAAVLPSPPLLGARAPTDELPDGK